MFTTTYSPDDIYAALREDVARQALAVKVEGDEPVAVRMNPDTWMQVARGCGGDVGNLTLTATGGRFMGLEVICDDRWKTGPAVETAMDQRARIATR